MTNKKDKLVEMERRDQRIMELLTKDGWTPAEIAKEYKTTAIKVNDLIAKFTSQGLIKKTKKGFVIMRKRTLKI